MNDELSAEAKNFLSLATSEGEVSPSDADRKRLQKRVGIALASGAGVAASGVVASGTASAAAGSAGIAGLTTGGLGLKAMVVVALVSGVVGVGALTVSSPEVPDVEAGEVTPALPEQSRPSQVAPGSSEASVPATPPIAAQSESGEALEAEARADVVVPAAESAIMRPRRSRSTGSVSATPTDEGVATMSLSDELGLLQAAQRARVQGDFDEALLQLDEHKRRFPGGRLAAERDGTRVFVLCDASRGAEATRAQGDFLRDHSTSPLAHRVRSGCD